MTGQLIVGLLVGALLTGFGYWLGRRSNVEHAMDRLQAKEFARPRLNSQKAQDAGEATDG